MAIISTRTRVRSVEEWLDHDDHDNRASREYAKGDEVEGEVDAWVDGDVEDVAED
jgi:hypothetical protein